MPRYDQKLTGKEVFVEAENANYGRKNRPPTPIKDVVNNEFGLAAAQALGKHQDQIAKVKISIESNFVIASPKQVHDEG